jgi:hypothetical protein
LLGQWSSAQYPATTRGAKQRPSSGNNSGGRARGAAAVTIPTRRRLATVIGLIGRGVYSKRTGPRSSTDVRGRGRI